MEGFPAVFSFFVRFTFTRDEISKPLLLKFSLFILYFIDLWKLSNFGGFLCSQLELCALNLLLPFAAHSQCVIRVMQNAQITNEFKYLIKPYEKKNNAISNYYMKWHILHLFRLNEYTNYFSKFNKNSNEYKIYAKLHRRENFRTELILKLFKCACECMCHLQQKKPIANWDYRTRRTNIYFSQVIIME